MTTALLIICALLLVALVISICAMLIYTHKRIDHLVYIINGNSKIGNSRFDELYKNNRVLKGEIEKLTDAHNGLVSKLAENEKIKTKKSWK